MNPRTVDALLGEIVFSCNLHSLGSLSIVRGGVRAFGQHFFYFQLFAVDKRMTHAYTQYARPHARAHLLYESIFITVRFYADAAILCATQTQTPTEHDKANIYTHTLSNHENCENIYFRILLLTLGNSKNLSHNNKENGKKSVVNEGKIK